MASVESAKASTFSSQQGKITFLILSRNRVSSFTLDVHFLKR